MPISLDEGFAGALGVEFGVGAQMAEQLDRLGRALERRRDPLTRIGFDTYEAIRAMAASLGAPPAWVTPVRIVNLGFIELMAGGTFVFAILIYLKLDAIWRRMGATNVKLDQIIDVLGQCMATTQTLFISLIGVLTTQLSAIVQVLASLSATLTASIYYYAHVTIERIYDIGPNLRSIDLGDLVASLAVLTALMPLIAAFGIPAGIALLAFGIGAMVAAAGIYLVAKALDVMPENAGDLMLWTGVFIGALAAIIVAFGLLLSGGKAVAGIIVGVVGSIVLLFGIAAALNLMPDNTWELVKSLIALGVGLGLLMTFFKGLDENELWNIGIGFLALAGFLLLTAAAFRIFDETAIQAMEAMPAFFDALNSLAENILSKKDDLQTIGIGLAGIVVFVGLLGLALRLFPDDAAPALEAMAQVLSQLTSIADKIVELSEGGHLETVAKGLLGIVIFVGLLGLALMLFDEQSIQAAYAVAALTQAFAALATALAAIDPANIWIIIGVLAALAATTIAIGLAAQLGGPHLNSLANALRALSELLNTVASNAAKLAEALSSLPSISLPSLPSLPSIPGMATGGPVDSTGPYLLHAGEHVLNPAQTAAMRAAGAGGGSAGAVADNSVSVGNVNISVTAQSVDDGSIPALGDEIVRQIASRLAEIQRDDAFAQGVRSEVG